MKTPADLVALAESAGARVEWTPVVERADYFMGTIRVNPRLSESAQVVAIAHELGHHHHGHVGNSPRFEVQANAYAAQLLIDPDDYAAAERLCEGHAGAMARELGVTMAIVDAWRRCHKAA